MKAIKRIISVSFSTTLTLLFTGGFFFAQDISLPDITTVVQGGNVQADDEALPDFTDVMVLPQGSGASVPVLQELDAPDSSEVKPITFTEKERSVYVEGLIGAGYPTLFIGDFSLFRQAGNSPFKLTFMHDSALGYSGTALTDSFSDRTTSITLDKGFKREKYNLSFGGSYKTESNGLQNKTDGISSYNQSLVSADGKFEFFLPYGFSLCSEASMDFYNRYSDISSAVYDSVLVWARKNTLYGISPSLFVKWNNYGFSAALTGNYSLSADLFDEIEGSAANRGSFKLDFAWANDYINAYGNAALVFGNYMNTSSVLVPFTLGINSAFPVYFSDRRFSIYAEGGLESFQNKIFELEEKYVFSAFSFFPTESSDWFAKLGMKVPLKESFTGEFEIEYRNTAFGNGIWEPLYDDTVLTNGLYGYVQTERQLLKSDFNISYHYKIFSIKAGWQSNWLYIPVLETPQALTLSLDFQGRDSLWGAELSSAFYIGEGGTDPVINLECFARLTPAVRIVGNVEDIVKLMKGEQRIYAGQYAARGGTAKILLKFFF